MLAWLPTWINSGKIGVKLFNNIHELEKGILFNLINDKYLEWISEYGGEQIKMINDTTKKITRKIIKDGLTAGDSTKSIVENLSKKLNEYSTSRAQVIAETEIHNTIMHAHALCGEIYGYKYKKWITSDDTSVRPTHQVLNGQIRKINDKFSNGGMYPGDPSLPAKETVRCRCIVRYLMYEDD